MHFYCSVDKNSENFSFISSDNTVILGDKSSTNLQKVIVKTKECGLSLFLFIAYFKIDTVYHLYFIFQKWTSLLIIFAND